MDHALTVLFEQTDNMVEIINALFKYPITQAKQIAAATDFPMTSINRYLGQLVENKILYTDIKGRNRK